MYDTPVRRGVGTLVGPALSPVVTMAIPWLSVAHGIGWFDFVGYLQYPGARGFLYWI